MQTLKTFKFTKAAFEDYQMFKSKDIKTAKKIRDLIQNIMETPFTGLGKPEALRFDLSGYWSRRINQEHRLVYRVENDELIIISCRYHYN